MMMMMMMILRWTQRFRRSAAKLPFPKWAWGIGWYVNQMEGQGLFGSTLPLLLGNHVHANHSTFFCFRLPRGPFCGKHVDEIRCLGPVRYASGSGKNFVSVGPESTRPRGKGPKLPCCKMGTTLRGRNPVWRCTNLYWNGNLERCWIQKQDIGHCCLMCWGLYYIDLHCHGMKS